MTEFTLKVIEIINHIPKGKVMTYGQVARLAGSNRGARQVVRVLHTMSEKYDLPWHRVIAKDGKIAERADHLMYMQKNLLGKEGIEIMPKGQINLVLYQVNKEEENYNG